MASPLGFTAPWTDRVIPAVQDRPSALEEALPPLTWVQRHTGLAVRGVARIRQLLLLLRQACDAEDDGRFRRSDFLWLELYRRLRACWHDDAAWAAAAGTVAIDGSQLRTRVGLEGLLQQHCARFNGRLAEDQELAADDRAFFHAGRIGELLDIGGDALQPGRHMALSLAQQRIDALRRARRLDEAISEWSTLLKHDGEQAEHADLLAELHVERALAVLQGGDSESANRADAKRLRTLIDGFEQARKQYPRSIGFYRGLARCQRVLAVRLANSGELAEALGAIRMARKYDPHFDDAVQDEQQLDEMMKRLQAEMAEVRQRLAVQPGSQLNADGLKMQRNAERGFADLNGVEGSALARSLAEDFVRAHDREIWQVVGLAAPADQWEARAQALREALLPLFSERAADASALDGAWAARKAEQPLLQDCDDRTVCDFLRRRLFDIEPPPSDVVAAAAKPEPVPAVRTSTVRRSLEPAGLWLFGRQDFAVKFGAGLALVALLVAAGVLWRESDARRARDEAWQAIQTAVRTHDESAVMKAAEAFFAARPHAQDGREAEARRLYDEAFTQWFVAQGYALDESTRGHLDEYQALQTLEPKP